MSNKKDEIARTLRALVAMIYNDCYGAYGSSARYSGEYEPEIQACAQAIKEAAQETAKETK